jgi:hypothetical protein
MRKNHIYTIHLLHRNTALSTKICYYILLDRPTNPDNQMKMSCGHNILITILFGNKAINSEYQIMNFAIVVYECETWFVTLKEEIDCRCS